jgi:hypothetical protein
MINKLSKRDIVNLVNIKVFNRKKEQIKTYSKL